MTEPREKAQEPRIRRILVAADGSQYGMAALQAAAHVASIFDAELTVLYVEDVDFLTLPRVSWLRELDPISGKSRRLEPLQVERSVRLEATRVRKSLEEVVRRTEVRSSFRVSRGRVISELQKAAREADLVSLGARRHSMSRGPGSTARAFISQEGTPVMMLWKGGRLGKRVCVLFDGSPEARRGLGLAARISQGRKSELFLLLDAPDRDRERLEELVASLLPPGMEEDEKPSIVPSEAGWRVARHLKKLACGLLVVPRKALEQSPPLASGIRDGLDCPLLILD